MSDPCPWTPLGPSAVGHAQVQSGDLDWVAVVSGRVTALAYTPAGDRLFVGTAGGGVWTTTDEGQTWTQLSDQLISLSIGAIAVASDGTVYIGTGENNGGGPSVMAGCGILVPDNIFLNWRLFPDPVADQKLLGQSIGRIVVDSNDSSHLFVASSIGLLEGNFSAQLTATPTDVATGSCTDVTFDRAHAGGGRLLAAFSGIGIFVRDGGVAGDPMTKISFAKFPGLNPAFGRVTLAMAPSDPKTVYAAFGGASDSGVQIFRSVDSGDSWESFPNPGGSAQTSYNAVLAVDPTDSRVLFYGEVNLWRRLAGADKGWDKVSEAGGKINGHLYPGIHADQHALVFHPTNPAIVWAGNDGGVWRSDDHGTHFDGRNRDLATVQAYTVANDPKSPAALLLGSQDNGAVRYVNHPFWSRADSGDCFYTAIDPVDSKFWYSSFEYDSSGNEISRSSQHGKTDSFTVTGQKIADTRVGGQPSIVPYVVVPPTPRIYLATDRFSFSDNRGFDWEEVPKTKPAVHGNYVTAIAAAPNNPRVVYYARRNPRKCGRIEQRPDGTWTDPVESNGELPGVCNSIAVDPLNEDRAFFGIGFPFTGDNGVARWRGPDFSQPVTANPILQTRRVWQIESDPIDGLSLKELGILPPMPFRDGVLLDAGDPTPPTFSLAGEINQVNAILVDPAHPTTLWVGCDIGVFKSTDGGQDWVRWDEGLPTAAVSDLQFHEDKRLIRASSLGRGIWERSADDQAADCEPIPGVPKRDVYLRDSIVDRGLERSPDDATDPVGTDTVHWNDGIDIKIDSQIGDTFFTEKATISTVNYEAGGPLDYVGFEDPRFKSARLQGGGQSRVFVQVHNRGPGSSTKTTVRLFFAQKGAAGFPPLPGDFRTAFPNDPADVSVWIPMGPAQEIHDLRPASPRVVRQDFAAPLSLRDSVGVLAVISAAEDPLPTTDAAGNALTTDVKEAVVSDKHLALKEVIVDPSVVGLALDLLTIFKLH